MRTVVEVPGVMESVDDAEEHWTNAHKAWAAITWALSKDPTVGFPLSEGGDQRSIVYDGSWAHDMPTIYVLYQITDTQVIIEKAEFKNANTTAGNA